MNEKYKFSVLMAVYKNDNPEYLVQAIDSIINQTLLANEIVIVIDGPVPECISIILDDYNVRIDCLKLLWLPENIGLGSALREGLKQCSFELVARMDSDDISLPNRFERQIASFKKHPDVSLIGTNISEFIRDPNNIVSHRRVPSTDFEIKKYLKSRSPFNHMSVMFKKIDVEKAGSYKHWYLNEDYYLWIRMTLIGCEFMNLNEVLVNMRIDEKTFLRRGGWGYFITQKKIFDYMLQNKMINIFEYTYNNFVRFVTRILLPNNMRSWLYRKLLRS